MKSKKGSFVRDNKILQADIIEKTPIASSLTKSYSALVSDIIGK
jgi:hypothetical protein